MMTSQVRWRTAIMKHILTPILLLTFLFPSLATGEELSLAILDKLFEEGDKICRAANKGSYLLEGNPITFVDISNDGKKDLIINAGRQRCSESYTFFAGGTGGNDFTFLINPTINSVKSWNPADLKPYINTLTLMESTGDPQTMVENITPSNNLRFQFDDNNPNRSFTMFIHGYDIIKWKGKDAVKIYSHGIDCDVAGVIGCYSIFLASNEGLRLVKTPTPNR